MTKNFEVSVVVPIYNEEKYIENCISSILNQDFPKERLKAFLVDGGSSDNTIEIIKKYEKQYDFIHLLNNSHKTVPYALNIGIKASNLDVVVIMGAHAAYPNNYVSYLTSSLFELDADNVGVTLNTLPAKNNSVCQAISISSSHIFGVGNSLHKIGTDKVVETDTVTFGCYKREVFNKIGLYDTDLIRNQDDELNARIIQSGGKIYLLPKIKIDYFARDSISKMAKMYYQYGLFKPLVNKKLRKPATIRQFFPPAFVGGIIIGAILSFFSPVITEIYFSVLILYFILAFGFSVAESFKNKRIALLFLLPICFFLNHISYGTGYWKGLYKVVFNREFSAKVNR